METPESKYSSDANNLCEYANALVSLPVPAMSTVAGKLAICNFQDQVKMIARAAIAEAVGVVEEGLRVSQ